MQLEIHNINGQKICLSGVGKLFYQDGLPISISANKLKKQGIKLSWLHVADECLKHGWSPKTTYRKIREDIADSGEKLFDTELLYNFCHTSYEDQRDMIFKDLFKDVEQAKEWLEKQL